MKRITLLAGLLALLLAQPSSAQSDTGTKQTLKLKLGLNYNSHLHYYGRTDSLQSQGAFALAELWLGDWYLNAAPVFIHNASQPLEYAGSVVTLGYLHVSDRWITSLYALKPVYKKESRLVQSALKAQAGASFTLLSEAVNITAGGDTKWSDRLDFGATAGIDHLFKRNLSKGRVLVVDPSAYAYAGTRQFTSTYRKNNGYLLFPGGGEEVVRSTRQFCLLAYEVSVPVVYVQGRWMVLLTPSYVAPQNLVTVAGRPELSETGRRAAYLTAGIKYSF